MIRDTEIMDMIAKVMTRNAPRLRGHRVFLFGSRATGNAGSHSDFDIGVMGDEPLPLEDFYAIEDQLDELPTLHKIDWVDFNRVSSRFRERAMQQIEVIHE
ncbi:MAG: nucleotidyltransferase domain-containing protein [Hydrogenophilaceae bacterium]|nr:nucleotidyltransferase domain-containing protein [Hydrogenophilaceae bacterium]